MPKPNEDSYLTRKLLSPPPSVPSATERVTIVNEMATLSEKENYIRLHRAVDDKNLDEIKKLITENPALVFDDCGGEGTPLHSLVISADETAPEIAKLLLGVTESRDGRFTVERESALHVTDCKGYTPLHASADNWLPELTECFLKYGANPAAKDLQGDTPFHFAAEGKIQEALECVKVILKYDKTGSLINLKNGEEHTGLHRAVKKQAVNMVKLLLENENMQLSQHTSNSGQNILQYLCIESGESKNSCEILKTIAQTCTKEQLNSVDSNGQTVLHTAAIERLPQITKILVSDEKMDVLKLDKRKRTALHYAAENGSYPDGYRCVEGLIIKKFDRTKTQAEYLYEKMDEMGSSAFMYACLNCPVETLHKYLDAIREPQFWMSETNMTLVYKQCPLAIKALMDGAFSERKRAKSSELDVIVADFGPITGYTDPVEKLPQQETKYLKNALWWDYETQKEILMHPLVQLFVVKKCRKLRAIIHGWILWQIMWLVAYTLLALSTYCKVINSEVTEVAASAFVLIYIVVSLINEVFELCSVGLRYVLNLSNIFQLAQIGFAVVAISPVLFGVELSIIHKNCAAIGILLAYILSMRDIGKMHEEIGLVVEVLKQVVIQIVKVLLCCSPLLFGFTLAFVILFNDDESLNTSFPGPLVKVLVMMTGEFEYNDTFKELDEDGKVNPDATKNRAIRLLLFLSFLICVPVAFFNLLTGFALERVMELRERAKVGRIAKQLEHIHFIESILLSLRPLQKLLSHGKLARRIRRYNVTTAMIDGDLKFETFINEETHKKIDRRTAKEKQLDLCYCIKSVFGTELPSEVRHQIFALASRQSHMQQE